MTKNTTATFSYEIKTTDKETTLAKRKLAKHWGKLGFKKIGKKGYYAKFTSHQLPTVNIPLEIDLPENVKLS